SRAHGRARGVLRVERRRHGQRSGPGGRRRQRDCLVIADADAQTRSLLARIAQLADSGDLDEYVTLFADDAVWAMPDNPSLGMPASEKRGIAALGAGAEQRRADGVQGPGTTARHVLTTTAVFVDSDDRASARSYF